MAILLSCGSGDGRQGKGEVVFLALGLVVSVSITVTFTGLAPELGLELERALPLNCAINANRATYTNASGAEEGRSSLTVEGAAVLEVVLPESEVK